MWPTHQQLTCPQNVPPQERLNFGETSSSSNFGGSSTNQPGTMEPLNKNTVANHSDRFHNNKNHWKKNTCKMTDVIHVTAKRYLLIIYLAVENQPN